MRNLYGVLLAGGTGSRLDQTRPKQFLPLGGKPLFCHSLEGFRKFGLFHSLILVSHPKHIQEMEELASPLLEERDRVVEGGDSRHESTLLGLQAVSWDKEDIFLIHDTARPFFSQEDLFGLVEATWETGAASLVSRVTETVVRGSEKATEIVDRENLYLVKTPQGIRGDVAATLLKKTGKEAFTDLCSWVSPLPVALLEAKTWNPKITSQMDLGLAESYLKL